MENHQGTILSTIDSTSDIMNDHCIAEILKYLTFNEKSKCRLISHQFKRVVDSFTLKTLVCDNFIHWVHSVNANDFPFSFRFDRYTGCF